MSKRDESTKLRAVEIIIIGFVCLFLLAVIWPSSKMSRFNAYRTECNKNLSEIGRAMLIYANNYDGQLPRSGGRNSIWAVKIPDWKADNRFKAYGLTPNGSGGAVNISSCFYLLVKYMDIAPKTFACPGEARTTEFKLADVDAGDRELDDLWDFGPEAGKHCSYAYHMPFGLYALTTSHHPAQPVAADRNPWMYSPFAIAKDMRFFNPESGRDFVKAGNAIAHEEEGQNVLFLDGHVAFEDHSFCGLHDDNIYTYWNGGDIRIGGTPYLGSEPQDKIDSLLVNDPSPPRGTIITKDSEAIDSTDLEKTSIVATLDCPIPEHKNVIWCSTFQITWDKLKNGIIREPVKVPQAAELAARLNQAEFSPENLEAESFYAAVGFVRDGIIKQIRKEMRKRFPSEPLLILNGLDRQPEIIVSYSFLKTDIEFRYPFYTREKAFAFEDSYGHKANVTSFCDYTNATDPNEELVREQIDILYYKYADEQNAAEYAVDLCRDTNPYQVILGLVPRKDTLGEIVTAVEKKISEFRHDPDYEVLCKLRPGSLNRPDDRLIVPDVLYKIIHHFTELQGKPIESNRLPGYWFVSAIQVIDFALSRTGVVLKSEAISIAAPFSPRPRLEIPRNFYFNKPFLIYVKKRGPDYFPFFVMWVDNAELIEKF